MREAEAKHAVSIGCRGRFYGDKIRPRVGSAVFEHIFLVLERCGNCAEGDDCIVDIVLEYGVDLGQVLSTDGAVHGFSCHFSQLRAVTVVRSSQNYS